VNVTEYPFPSDFLHPGNEFYCSLWKSYFKTGTAAIISRKEPGNFENISWNLRSPPVPIYRRWPDSLPRKAGSTIPGMPKN